MSGEDIVIADLRRQLDRMRERADEAAATIDQLRVELVTAQHEVGEAWFAGGATLAEAIRRKSAVLERMQPRRGQMAAFTIKREDGTLEWLTILRKS